MEIKATDESPTIATTTVALEAHQQEESSAVVATTRPVPIKGKRRNLGRQARKRRKKYLEIEAAASAFVTAATAAILDTNPTINTEDANTTTLLPTDRGYVLDGVKHQTELSNEDRRDLIRQLGYLPGNALRVASRIEDAFSSEELQKLFASATSTPTAEDGAANSDNKRSERMASMIQNMMKEPLVLKLYPLALRDESSSTKRRRKRRREEDASDKQQRSTITNENSTPSDTYTNTPLMEPFPTIYWVTHPLIKALISKLELDRLNVQFEEKLANEASPLESMKRAHKSYGIERRELLSSHDRDYVKGRNWYGVEQSTFIDASPLVSPNTTSIPPFSELCGVAGIRNPKAVKCLHAHSAHYWSGNKDNLVGHWVSERLKSGRAFFQGSIEDQTEHTTSK